MVSRPSRVRLLSASRAPTPRLKVCARLLRLKRVSQRTQPMSARGRITSAPPGSKAERSPVATIPGAASGVESDGVSHPVLPRDAPAPVVRASTSVTSCPSRASHQAHESPIAPPPTTTTVRPAIGRS